MLELESQWFGTASGKEDAIRDLGMRPVRYYQVLNRLITREAALAYAPTTVSRLLRIATSGLGRPVPRAGQAHSAHRVL
ncbi:DUF3263 domain-containing protein [Mycolicibacterium sp. F2034L]|nr:DUF3263 domain-containing protein [Mycolicibacterium sp. F2034L]